MEENEKLKLDEKYMRAAIKQAQKAYAINETPIGCVIVYEGKIIGRGYNRRNTDKDPLAHAEIKAIKKASKKMGDWRLEQCTMYVTLEPCQMCAGAIIQSRLTRVVVGCMNPKAGCAGSVLNLLDIKQFNHQAELTTGVLEEECSEGKESPEALKAHSGIVSGRQGLRQVRTLARCHYKKKARADVTAV